MKVEDNIGASHFKAGLPGLNVADRRMAMGMSVALAPAEEAVSAIFDFLIDLDVVYRLSYPWAHSGTLMIPSNHTGRLQAVIGQGVGLGLTRALWQVCR